MHKLVGFVGSLALMSSVALAQPTVERAVETEVRDYLGNTLASEKVEALSRRGNAEAGRSIYKDHCEACHMATGGGQPDGSIAQLAGQHGTVLIKQLTDIRSGLRYNPMMYPFARKLANPQAIADVAAYVSTLCIPLDSGKYPGPDAAAQIAAGKRLYDRECAQCHQPNGEGLKEMFYPVLAGQHYQYLLRQMSEIRDGKRVNIPNEMFKVITRYDNSQLVSVAAYQASLSTPRSMMGPRNAMCKPAASKVVKAK